MVCNFFLSMISKIYSQDRIFALHLQDKLQKASAELFLAAKEPTEMRSDLFTSLSETLRDFRDALRQSATARSWALSKKLSPKQVSAFGPPNSLKLMVQISSFDSDYLYFATDE